MDGFLAPAHRSSLQPTPTWMAEIANGYHIPLVSHRQAAPAQNWVRHLILFAKHVGGRRCLLGCLALPIHSLRQNMYITRMDGRGKRHMTQYCTCPLSGFLAIGLYNSDCRAYRSRVTGRQKISTSATPCTASRLYSCALPTLHSTSPFRTLYWGFPSWRYSVLAVVHANIDPS